MTAASTVLHTDRYEYTMLDAALRDGTAHRVATFEAFTRRLPPGYRYGIVAGIERVADAVTNFTFDADTLRWLHDQHVVSTDTVRYLEQFRFTGDLDVYLDGDLWFPNSPVVAVTAPFGQAVILETILLSILNSGCGTATHAAKITEAAAGRPVIEMASRRTHDAAAVDVARDAYIAGFASTSNLAAGHRYRVPTVGTTAHAWTLAHDTEHAAFVAQLTAHGPDTTLLIDTYDVTQGAHNAIAATREVCGQPVAAVRIDSGDLATNARLVRGILDAAGFGTTRIVLTSDLDAATIADLVSTGTPVDGFGVGTKLVEAPKPGFVYKLVAIETNGNEMRPVAKTSPGKVSYGGRKFVTRITDPDDGTVTEERLTVGGASDGYLVQRRLFTHGALNDDTVNACRTEPARRRCDTEKPSVPSGRTVTVTGPEHTQPAPRWEMTP